MSADHSWTTLSPRQAARLIDVGRSSIMRAIAAGNLPARRDNRNQWQIEREALDRWNAARVDRDQPMPMVRSEPDRTTLANHSETTLKLEVARATIAQLEARLDERAALIHTVEARAQAAEALAEKLTDLLAAHAAPVPPPAPVTKPRRRWWPWN